MSELSYSPYAETHERAKGLGSLRPPRMPLQDAGKLLNESIRVPGHGEHKRWAASGRWCFCAHPTRREENCWHGFPVIGGEVPEAVLRALEEAGHISRQERRRLRKQRSLPEEWR